MTVVIGLTGGIASGKSTVANCFAALGVPVVDADQLAQEVVLPGTEGLAEVVAAFGTQYRRDDGSLNRAKLGEYVFTHPEERKKLNAILHPRIAAVSAERIRKAFEQHPPYVIYEAALLVENELHRNFSALVVVDCSKETQIRRLMQRDGFSREQSIQRIEAQATPEQRLAVADYVVHNDDQTSLEELEKQVKAVHQSIVEKGQRAK